MARRLLYLLKSLTQRIIFSFEQFSRHEMANHAAAGAYAFLLSAMPAMLLVVFISTRVLAVLDLDPSTVSRFLEPFLGDFGAAEVSKAFLSRPMTGLAGIFGLVNLVWAARLFVVSIQRGIRVIYVDVVRPSALREHLLTFAVELILLFTVIILIVAAQILQGLAGILEWQAARDFLGGLVFFSLRYLPSIILWLFVFLTYHTIPKHRPKRRYALVASVLCILAFWLFGQLLALFLSSARYGLLYGLLGNVISTLLKVFGFFWLYFLFAELTYTIEFFDILLFSRFSRLVSPSGAQEREGGRLERLLFAKPQRLFRRYARSYTKGQLVFAWGDPGTEALYLFKGSVAIYLDDPDDPAVSVAAEPLLIKEGQFFGEMGSVLGELRSAWAVAVKDTTVFALPASLFERYLASDPGESRKMIALLAQRLKRNNEQLRQGDVL